MCCGRLTKRRLEAGGCARAAPIRCAAAALAGVLLPLAGGRMRCPLSAAAAINAHHAGILSAGCGRFY